MKKTLILIRTLVLGVLLTTLAPAWAQTQNGYDDDQPVETSQRDNEDHETSLGWVGLFGLLGATYGDLRAVSQRVEGRGA